MNGGGGSDGGTVAFIIVIVIAGIEPAVVCMGMETFGDSNMAASVGEDFPGVAEYECDTVGEIHMGTASKSYVSFIIGDSETAVVEVAAIGE